MARFLTGIRVERRVITVPSAQPVTGCVVPTEDACCDGGSGSGTFCEEGCTSLCPACVSMAKRWEFISPGDEGTVTLCYLTSSNDGNPCSFLSEDMVWRLYLSVLDVWTLENLDTGDLFFLSNDEWDCTGLNHMESALGENAVDVSPVDSCGEVMGWDCVDDDCVEQLGGLYPTQQACIDSGCGQPPIGNCCDFSTGWPETLECTVIAPGDCGRTITLTKVGSGTSAAYVFSTSPGATVFCFPEGTPPYYINYALFCDTVLKCAIQVVDSNNVSQCAQVMTVKGTCCPTINLFNDGIEEGECTDCCGGPLVTMHITGECP